MIMQVMIWKLGKISGKMSRKSGKSGRTPGKFESVRKDKKHWES